MDCEASAAWMNLIDEESGLYNRLHLVHFLTEAFARAQRYGGPLSCVLFRAAWWRRLEEVKAPPAEAVRALGRFFLLGVRQGDIIGRWSDEEFLLVAPGTSRGSAGMCMKNILVRLAREPWMPGRGLSVSVHAAEAGLPEDEAWLRYPEDLPLLARERLAAAR